MEHVEYDGDLLLCLLPNKLVVHIASNKNGDFLLENRIFIDFRQRLVTALDDAIDASGVYTAL